VPKSNGVSLNKRRRLGRRANERLGVGSSDELGAAIAGDDARQPL
jgi:hypothetical protein